MGTRYCLLCLLALSLVCALAGCATESARSEPARVRVGMSRDDLKFFFGNPSRIEPLPDGGEDWYYSFATSSPPQVESSSVVDPFGGRTDTVSVTVSDNRTVQRCPIHLSADGLVIEPIPEGKLVGR